MGAVLTGAISTFWASLYAGFDVPGSFMRAFVLGVSMALLGWDMASVVFEARSAIMRLVSEMMM